MLRAQRDVHTIHLALRAESLGEFAERGQIVPEFRDPTIRELLVRPYRLVYKLSTSRVTVIAVIHGARRA